MNRYSRLVHRTCFIVRRFIYQPKSQLPLITTTNTYDHIQFASKCRTDLEVKPAYKKCQVLSLKQSPHIFAFSYIYSDRSYSLVHSSNLCLYVCLTTYMFTTIFIYYYAGQDITLERKTPKKIIHIPTQKIAGRRLHLL